MANMIFDAAFLSRGVSGDGTSPEYEPIQRVVAEKIYIFSLLATVCDIRRHSLYSLRAVKRDRSRARAAVPPLPIVLIG